MLLGEKKQRIDINTLGAKPVSREGKNLRCYPRLAVAPLNRGLPLRGYRLRAAEKGVPFCERYDVAALQVHHEDVALRQAVNIIPALNF
jgi:hypothetical protein